MPELGSINLGPGAGQPQSAGVMDPIPLIQKQAQQQLTGLDSEWSQKYQQLNKLYDWSRHEKYPDEITRLRGRLEQDISGRRQAVKTGMQNTVSKFKMLDHLFPNNPEQANKLKWTAAVGKEMADSMFPQHQDPRVEHQRNVAEQNRLEQVTSAFAVDNGKLYASKIDKSGYVTGEADRKKPATPEEIQLWAMSSDAMSVLEQEERDILNRMSDAGMPDPSYLQRLAMGQKGKGFFKTWLEETGFRMRGGTKEGLMRKRTGFTPEPNGTFAQKVTETLPKRSQRAGRKLTTDIARKYLMQHGGNRQAAMAAATADGYQ